MHLFACVCKEGEGKGVLSGESGVGFLAVLAHSYYVVARCDEGIVVVPQGTCFGGTAGSVVFRVKINDSLLPDEIF